MGDVIDLRSEIARRENERYRRIAQRLTDKTKWCHVIGCHLPIGRSCEACNGCDKKGA